MSKVRIKFDNNEIEVEGTDSFIQKQLKDYFNRLGKSDSGVNVPIVKKNGSKPAINESGRNPSPAEYYKSFGKTDGISVLIIFAKYLELYKGKNEFSPKDINEIGKLAKLKANIASTYFTRAVERGYLRSDKESVYNLTQTGEDYLNTLKSII